MSAVPHIVIVDDEEDLREPVVDYLRLEGMNVSGADSGAALDRILAQGSAALVVLDVNMPGEDGFSIARRLRSARPELGIVMLTAKRDVIDRVVGLEIGADDYLTKPFEPRELLARLRSLLRRLSAAAGESQASAASSPSAVLAQETGYPDAIWVQGRNGGSLRVLVDSIERIEAAKDYVLLHTREKSHMLRSTMSALEEILDPDKLVRVHRSAFIRPGAVVELRRTPGGGTVARLESGAETPVSNAYVVVIEELLRNRVR